MDTTEGEDVGSSGRDGSAFGLCLDVACHQFRAATTASARGRAGDRYTGNNISTLGD